MKHFFFIFPKQYKSTKKQKPQLDSSDAIIAKSDKTSNKVLLENNEFASNVQSFLFPRIKFIAFHSSFIAMQAKEDEGIDKASLGGSKSHLAQEF